MFVFISHASEDKNEVARPLAEELKKLGVEVWYDEYSLRLGDSLHEKIEEGLAKCRFGIVILSENFFDKNWSRKELGGLFARHTPENRFIIPVWHDIDVDFLKNNYPMLADIYATNTKKGINIVAREISSEIKKKNDSYLDISNWIDVQKTLFPSGIPSKSEWQNLDDIINVLNIICLPALNHMFMPDSGGLDLDSARRSFEQGLLELNHLQIKARYFDDPNPLELEEGHSAIILKPKKLSFHSFSPHFEMTYFWLECDEIPPIKNFPVYNK